jgi:hypothetical protein
MRPAISADGKAIDAAKGLTGAAVFGLRLSPTYIRREERSHF